MTRTSAYRGTYVEQPDLRREFVDMSGIGRGAMTAGTLAPEAPADTWRIEPLFESPDRAGSIRSWRRPPSGARSGDTARTSSIGLRSDRPTIVSNFVSTLDGVVAFDTTGHDRRTRGQRRVHTRSLPHGPAPSDRRRRPRRRGHRPLRRITTCGRPAMSIRTSAPAFAAWRERPRAAASQPTTVIVSAERPHRSRAPGPARAPTYPVVLLTTDDGRLALRRLDLPPTVEVVVAGDHGRVEPDAIVAALADRDLDLVVCEGGPRLLGGLVGAGLVDELFLTIAPQIAGRSPELPRLALVEDHGFAIGEAPWASLASVMRSGDHLFLRYRM